MVLLVVSLRAVKDLNPFATTLFMVAEAVEVTQTTEVVLNPMVDLEAVELEEIMVHLLQLELQPLEVVEVVEVVHQIHPIETEPMVGVVFAF